MKKTCLGWGALVCSACFAAPFPPPAAPERDAAIPPPLHEQSPPASADHGALRIGSWNVRRLGYDASTNVPAVASLIDRHFDLIALEEVMETGTFEHAGYDALLNALGPDWTGQITATPSPNLASPFSEYYALLYRPALISPCDDFADLRRFPDGDGTRGDARPDRFLRAPAFGCYQVLGGDKTLALDFLLGVYHAHWGTGDAREIAAEVRGLDAVFAWITAERPTERDVFLLGDFNLGSSQLDPIVHAADVTEGAGSTLSPRGTLTEHLYDHLLVQAPEASEELLGPARVLDLRDELGDPKTYVDHISDHLPITAVLSVSQPDDD